MSTLDRINRARWSRDQKAEATRRFAAAREQERQQRLADLRAALPAYADLAGDALADQIMASMRAEIARLETA